MLLKKKVNDGQLERNGLDMLTKMSKDILLSLPNILSSHNILIPYAVMV